MKQIVLIFLIASHYICASEPIEPTESKKNSWIALAKETQTPKPKKLSKKDLENIVKKTLFLENLCKVIRDGDVGQIDPDSRKKFYAELEAELPDKSILAKAKELYTQRCKIIAASKTLTTDANELTSVATKIGQSRKAWKQTSECNFLRSLYDQKYNQLIKNGAKLPQVTNPKNLGEFLDLEVSFPL